MVQCRKTLWNPKSLDSALDYFFWCIICWLFYCFYKCRAQALLRLMGSKAKWSQATNSEGFSSTIQSDLFGSGKSRVNSILLIQYYECYYITNIILLFWVLIKVVSFHIRQSIYQRWANTVFWTEYEYHSESEFWPNTNTNNIRFLRMSEYEYE